MMELGPRCLNVIYLSVLCLSLCLPGDTNTKKAIKIPRCPATCSCTKDSAFCVDTKAIPKSFPPGIISLTIVNAAFTTIPEGAFSHLHLLQFLLLNSNTFSTISDDAFAGLSHLQYLFIENNEVQTLSKYAFRGLKSLTHLSLSNNNQQQLPRDLFKHLDLLTDLDLRGNSFHCDCKIKWLVDWIEKSNTSVPPIYCASPFEFQGRRIHDLVPRDFNCISADFAVYETFPFQSVSVESYEFCGDQFVAFAQPESARSALYCKPVVMDNTLYMVVAQLFGGSHIYKWEEDPLRFVKIQDIDTIRVRKPNFVETFHLDAECPSILGTVTRMWSFSMLEESLTSSSPVPLNHQWFTSGTEARSSLISSLKSQSKLTCRWSSTFGLERRFTCALPASLVTQRFSAGKASVSLRSKLFPLAVRWLCIPSQWVFVSILSLGVISPFPECTCGMISLSAFSPSKNLTSELQGPSAWCQSTTKTFWWLPVSRAIPWPTSICWSISVLSRDVRDYRMCQKQQHAAIQVHLKLVVENSVYSSRSIQSEIHLLLYIRVTTHNT
ncbi:leucine-rich repeat LGI family member 3 isoform X2 [Phycodurus eques]|uniref:leucine-rich repeat LGI family member 3 isoform X2 n=1 Tax=Phycodurus eques TaxID=693459 RepID=UPI002ACE10DA|nr:leucine-rich repeat LGI family member 3 isoform X2 [Phycodurus eques]